MNVFRTRIIIKKEKEEEEVIIETIQWQRRLN
jgi:hypothetical protein